MIDYDDKAWWYMREIEYTASAVESFWEEVTVESLARELVEERQVKVHLHTMKNEMRKLLFTTVILGLMSGGVLAHEQQYDNTKEPHEAPHKAKPPKGGHSSLANAATNPIANLVQFQIQNVYTSNSYNSGGDSNAFLLQPVIPIALPSETVPLMVTRTTLPYISTPDLGDGINSKNGFGDITTLGIFIPKLETKGVMVGLGYNLIVPTAGDNDFTGSGKWSVGPSFAYFNLQTPTWQWGLLGYSAFSFADNSSGREHVSNVSVQPILIKHFDEGWYMGLADVPQTYDFNANEWTFALGPRLGRVTKFGKQPVNLFGQFYYNPNDDTDEVAPEWSYKLNLTFLFPE